jgi:hypothetical protein
MQRQNGSCERRENKKSHSVPGEECWGQVVCFSGAPTTPVLIPFQEG